MSQPKLGFILLPMCSHVIWHVKILIHLVYDCSSVLTETHIKYSPTRPNSRQAQPSLTNEISAFIIHIKQTAPWISEPMFPDLTSLKPACCQHPLIGPELMVVKLSCEVHCNQTVTQKHGSLPTAPSFCLRGVPGERSLAAVLRALSGGAILFALL